MDATQVADARQERVNHLYWNSAETVEGISEQLGVSRGSLYAAVQPEPAGAECPDCAGELAFPNRTSRTAGRAVCLRCDRTVALEELPGHAVRYGNGAALGGLRDGLAAVEPKRAAMIGGAAMLGAVAGVASASLLRRFY
ncbi:MAG TPA: hypothetical protein VGR37_19660 [Longimicrobiaceae bacterium]|nr:hypothetical protein [Longimicrobiaceae bacterium]